MKQSEHEHQIGFVQWFREKYPELLIFSIPNGEKRHIRVAKRLKNEGTIRGIPDLMVVLPQGKSLWIEMKSETGRLSVHQKEILDKLDRYGHNYIVGYSSEDASQKVISFFEKYNKD